MRMPKGVSPASARPAAGLSCSQHKMKLLSAGVKTEFFSAGLSSPLMNAVPAGYFTQICNTTAAEQRANSLYSTPHGPEAKPIRASSGRLPVKTQTHTLWHKCWGWGHSLALLNPSSRCVCTEPFEPLMDLQTKPQGRACCCVFTAILTGLTPFSPQPSWSHWSLVPMSLQWFCNVCVGLGSGNIADPSDAKKGGMSDPRSGGGYLVCLLSRQLRALICVLSCFCTVC